MFGGWRVGQALWNAHAGSRRARWWAAETLTLGTLTLRRSPPPPERLSAVDGLGRERRGRSRAGVLTATRLKVGKRVLGVGWASRFGDPSLRRTVVHRVRFAGPPGGQVAPGARSRGAQSGFSPPSPACSAPLAPLPQHTHPCAGSVRRVRRAGSATYSGARAPTSSRYRGSRTSHGAGERARARAGVAFYVRGPRPKLAAHPGRGPGGRAPSPAPHAPPPTPPTHISPLPPAEACGGRHAANRVTKFGRRSRFCGGGVGCCPARHRPPWRPPLPPAAFPAAAFRFRSLAPLRAPPSLFSLPRPRGYGRRRRAPAARSDPLDVYPRPPSPARPHSPSGSRTQAPREAQRCVSSRERRRPPPLRSAAAKPHLRRAMGPVAHPLVPPTRPPFPGRSSPFTSSPHPRRT